MATPYPQSSSASYRVAPPPVALEPVPFALPPLPGVASHQRQLSPLTSTQRQQQQQLLQQSHHRHRHPLVHHLEGSTRAPLLLGVLVSFYAPLQHPSTPCVVWRNRLQHPTFASVTTKRLPQRCSPVILCSFLASTAALTVTTKAQHVLAPSHPSYSQHNAAHRHQHLKLPLLPRHQPSKHYLGSGRHSDFCHG